MTPVIDLEQLGMAVDGHTIVDDVNLTVGQGETVALLGPSGSGKSTLLRLILGLAAPGTGQLRLAGETVSVPGRVLVPPERRRLAVVFQDLGLWPHLTVEEHLAFGLRPLRLDRGEQERRVQEMLARVGLADKGRRMPGALSGGERQRVAIARALVVRPRAVLLDEPLASLDVALRRELLATFRSLLQEQAVTTLFVSHDLRDAARLGARVVVLEAGRMSQAGTVEEISAEPRTTFVRALVEDSGSRP
jgi:ABC-type Fe3+/spermidine/putrescine transport system ATPase subunit